MAWLSSKGVFMCRGSIIYAHCLADRPHKVHIQMSRNQFSRAKHWTGVTESTCVNQSIADFTLLLLLTVIACSNLTSGDRHSRAFIPPFPQFMDFSFICGGEGGGERGVVGVGKGRRD